METPDSRVKLAQAASAQLRQYLHTLASRGLEPAQCVPPLAVRDVVGHLILAACSTWASSPEGCKETPPPGRLPPAGTANAASWSALFDPMSVARRESLGDQLARDLHSHQRPVAPAPCRVWPAGSGDPVLSCRQSAPRADVRRSASYGVSDARVGHPLPV